VPRQLPRLIGGTLAIIPQLDADEFAVAV